MTNRNHDDRKRFRTCIPKDRDEIWQVLTWASEHSRFYLELRYKYTNYYTTISLIILGATIGALSNFAAKGYDHLWTLLILPAIVVALGFLARLMINGYHFRYLVYVAIKAKTQVVWFGAAGNEKWGDNPMVLFQDDENFLPESILDDIDTYNTSTEFISGKVKSGSNRIALRTFTLIQLMAILVSAIIIFLQFVS